MHINEVYEHDPILTCPSEESCPINGCSRVGTQCVNVAAPMSFSPTVVVGTPAVACQGTPVITCVTDPGGTSCTVTMTQQVCVSVPVRYGVELAAEDPTIACADSCVGSGCC